ncbi:MAG TPA: DUF6807 family protein, partial [Chitinophagaceae bacterium]|nr:DUF6807 family protein [Chitinophagaceae bacterium]
MQKIIVMALFTMAACTVTAQTHFEVKLNEPAHTVVITADGKPFTTFLFPDTLEKPVLYPVYAADGQLITRGFPVKPRTGEPTDHPNHLGIWFTYENVNGLDFWN